jgi:hypothetical protein
MSSENSKEKTNIVKAHHDLSRVNNLIRTGRYFIKPDVILDAYIEFGWLEKDILKAYRKLKPENCIKIEVSKKVKATILDFYEANVFGIDIYTHFYIDATDTLIINSFHKPPKKVG